MEYFFVYKTTNMLNGRFYIGVHKTKNLNDKYLGSGKLIQQAVSKYGAEHFNREILKFFPSYIEALAYEKELVTEDLIKEGVCYNLVVGGGKPPIMIGEDNPRYGKKSPESSLRMTLNNPGRGKFGEDSPSFNRVSVVDSNGETMAVYKDDPRYLSGELTHVNKGKITVRDKSGNVFHVTKDDPRYLSGEVSHATKNRVLECPYCHKVGGNSMKRWHFENCRLKNSITLSEEV